MKVPYKATFIHLASVSALVPWVLLVGFVFSFLLLLLDGTIQNLVPLELYRSNDYLVIAREYGLLALALLVMFLRRGFWYSLSLHMFYNFWIRAAHDRLVLTIAFCLVLLCSLALIVSLVNGKRTTI